MSGRPCALRVSSLAAMLNVEFADDPVYSAIELQWFDDDEHGTGMLAFLTRRDTDRVDYYCEPGVRPDPSTHQIGGGVGIWEETPFDGAVLTVAGDGVRAAATFTDADGRRIEVRVDDRDGSRRRRGCLLAPVSDGITNPTSLLLVWLPVFDLVHRGTHDPVVRIDGVDLTIGGLPGGWLHRRHLIKYAAPVVVIEVFPDDERGAEGPLSSVEENADGHVARLAFTPPLPALETVRDDATAGGRWTIAINDHRLTGGTWFAEHDDDVATAGLDVSERWKPPHNVPFLIRLVTTVVPVFRKWPTTYRWRAAMTRDGRREAGWTRTGTAGSDNYRRATGTR